MDTALLRSFTAVVRHGSFTAAARELGFVQSTVSAQVQSLERQLGVTLLDRVPGRVVVTEAGGRLLPLAEELLLLQERMREEVAAVPEQPAGPVRLAAPESLCAYRLPALVTRLRAEAPGVRLSLTPAGTDDAIEAVRRGTADAALVLEPELRAAGVDARVVGRERLVVLAAASPGREPVTWEDLAAGEALLLEDGCSYSDRAARALAAAGQPAERRTRFGSIEAVRRCVAAGLGSAVLPAVAVAADLEAGAVVALDGPEQPALAVHLLTRAHRSPTAALRAVVARLPDLWQSPA